MATSTRTDDDFQAHVDMLAYKGLLALSARGTLRSRLRPKHSPPVLTQQRKAPVETILSVLEILPDRLSQMELLTLQISGRRIKCVCLYECKNFSELHKHYFNKHFGDSDRVACDRDGCFWLGSLNTLRNHQTDHRLYNEPGSRPTCDVCNVVVSSKAHESTPSHCWNMLMNFIATAGAPERGTTTKREGVGEVGRPQNKHPRSGTSNPFQVSQARPTTGLKIDNVIYRNRLMDITATAGAPERRTTTKRERVSEVEWLQNKHRKTSGSNPFQISEASPAGELAVDDAISISDGDSETPKTETGVKRKAAGEVGGSYNKQSDIFRLLS